MPVTALRRALVLLAVGAVAGCGGPRVLSQPSPPSFGGALQLAAEAPIPVVVRHVPGGQRSDAYATQVIPAMPTAIGPTLRYMPAAGAPGDFRYSILFDFGYGGAYPLACAGPPEPPGPPAPLPASIAVTAAFCYGGSVVSSATGYLDAPPRPDDPQFRVLIRDLTLALLEPSEDRGASCRFVGC